MRRVLVVMFLAAGAVVPAGSLLGSSAAGAATPLDQTGKIAFGQTVHLSLGSDEIAEYTFKGKAGQTVSARVSHATWAPACGLAQLLRLVAPNGSTVGSDCLDPDGLVIEELPVDGVYTISVDLSDANAGEAALTLEAPGFQQGKIAFGQTVPLKLNKPGERARYTFKGKAGQTVSARVSHATWAPACSLAQLLRLVAPNGSTVGSDCLDPDGLVIEELPVDGVYTVSVDLSYDTTGKAALTVEAPGFQQGRIEPGQTKHLNLSKPGERAKYTFTGRAGDTVSASVTDATWAPACSLAQLLRLVAPNGSTVGSDCLDPDGLVTQVLPVDGTYTISVDLNYDTTGEADLTLTSP